MAFPRTGSSMTAGIFAKHGVWTGEYWKGDKMNPKGHFENIEFKRLAKKYGKVGIHKNKVFQPDSEFISEFLKINPVEPWLIKGSAMYWKLFEELKPHYICVRRPVKSVRESNKSSGLYFSDASYNYHNQEMDYLVDNRAGVNVYTDEVVSGNYESIQKAIESCGLEFDSDKVDAFVDKRHWHY